jgi:hypothetical protein
MLRLLCLINKSKLTFPTDVSFNKIRMISYTSAAFVWPGILLWKWSHHSVPGHSGHFGQGGRYRCDFNALFQGFWFSSSCLATYKIGDLGRVFEVDFMLREFVVGCRQRVRIGEQESKKVKWPQLCSEDRFGPTALYSVRKLYLEENWLEY